MNIDKNRFLNSIINDENTPELPDDVKRLYLNYPDTLFELFISDLPDPDSQELVNFEDKIFDLFGTRINNKEVIKWIKSTIEILYDKKIIELKKIFENDSLYKNNMVIKYFIDTMFKDNQISAMLLINLIDGGNYDHHELYDILKQFL
jgi:hypothetical protein